MPFMSRRAERLAAQRKPAIDLLDNRRDDDQVAFVPEVAELILNEQLHERLTAIPEPSPLVRVRDETGFELWMAPHPPGPYIGAPPVLPQKYRSKEFYRNGLIICSISLMFLTVFQVYVYILSKYYWPLHFFRLILDKVAFQGAYRLLINYLTLILGIHPLIMGSWILAGTFCFRNKVLLQFFTRSLYFCALNAVYTVLSIMFASNIPTNEVKKIMDGSMNTYDHDLKHPQPVRVATNEPWDRLQQHQQCCGINGQEDWIGRASQPGIPISKFKIPYSCCMVFKFDFFDGVARTPDGYLDDITECRNSPSISNSWQDGCLTNFIFFLQKFCAAFAFLEILTILFVAASSYFALKYFILIQHEKGNKDFDYTLAETCIHIWCLGYCIKYEKDRDTGEYVIIGRHVPHRLRKFTHRLTGLFHHHDRTKNLLGHDIEGNHESATELKSIQSTENAENHTSTQNTENAENLKSAQSTKNTDNLKSTGSAENTKNTGNAENDEQARNN